MRCQEVTHVDGPFDIYFCEKETDIQFEGYHICRECIQKKQENLDAEALGLEGKVALIRERQQKLLQVLMESVARGHQ